MLLADSAQVAEGKLFILGGGWSQIGPDPSPFAVAMKLEIPRHEARGTHHWELFLVDEDGHAIVIETDQGPSPIELRGDLTLGEPEGMLPGEPLDVPMAINFGPMPFVPGSRLTWRLTVDGEAIPGGTLTFNVRPPYLG
jgi:hypothetical protein